MTSILGISAFYHDAAAALVVDGRIVAAAQEERFTRIKHDPSFPQKAIDYCLAEAGLSVADLDYIGFYEKPLQKFDRLLETYLAYAPRGFRSFLKAIPVWLKQKLHLPREFNRHFQKQYKRRYVFTDHHESHAASAFFPSPFDEAAILTMDGVGEWATTTLGAGRGNRVTLTHELEFPHSLGLLYSAFTYYCGFKVNSGEYKLMGLAPYGTPKYADAILERLVDLKPDGSFHMDLSYFDYCAGLRMTSPRFNALFGGPARNPESMITEREMDLAASIQEVTEEVMLRMARYLHGQTGMANLCLAGGVALNCVGNGRILREGPFERLWIQPASGDAGGALGVAQFIWYQLLENERTPEPGDSQAGSYLGPKFSDAEILAALEADGAEFRHIADEAELCREVARQLAGGRIIGWFAGRMEYGPRALGARSILGDPRDPAMQRRMNQKIKFRESFRPFAPAVLDAFAGEMFEFDAQDASPYMLLVAPVHESRRLPVDPTSPGSLDELLYVRLAEPRSTIPAITHVDFSARLQTVHAATNPRFHRLLSEFHAITGCPVLINTSFNLRGEPIVCTPADALHTFHRTNIDTLVLEHYVVTSTHAADRAMPQDLARD